MGNSKLIGKWVNKGMSLKAYWRQDCIAGFLVFLIALPLCLGIAVASGFPPMAGILSAAVGGLLVSRINGSYITITGPAAGLIVVVLTAVQNLGQGDDFAGYRYTLAAIVVSGCLQIVLGFFKVGRLSTFFPTSVVHGMLAAIGIIIMVKQFPIMMGVTTRSGHHSILAGLPELRYALTYQVAQTATIALVSLAVLIFWQNIRHPILRKIPPPILVVLCGIFLGKFFDLSHIQPFRYFQMPEQVVFGPEFLITIPDSLLTSIVYPDFSKIATLVFWESVITITLIGSIESLLSATAVDKLDSELRQSDLNRELKAIGIGNLIAGLIGGLPMIAEIVRSSANVDAGARSGWANFFHGSFLLLFVLFFPWIINAIPLASLAVLLVYTGFRLASPETFARVLDIGKEQLAVFIVTIISILATNLLAGVFIGILVKLLMHLARGVPLRNILRLSYRIERLDRDTYLVQVYGSAIFSNISALKTQLAQLPDGRTVLFDLADVFLIDHSAMEFITHFRDDYLERGGHCVLNGLEEHEAFSEHNLAARVGKRRLTCSTKRDGNLSTL